MQPVADVQTFAILRASRLAREPRIGRMVRRAECERLGEASTRVDVAMQHVAYLPLHSSWHLIVTAPAPFSCAMSKVA